MAATMTREERVKNNPTAIGALMDMEGELYDEAFWSNIVGAIEVEHVTKQSTTGQYLPAHETDLFAEDGCGICAELLRWGIVS